MEESTTAVAYVGLIVSIITTLVGIINHKRIRSNCCGKVAEASIEIDNVSPTDKKKVEFRLPEIVVDETTNNRKSVAPS